MSREESLQPRYKVRIEKNVYFTMRDGVRLASDVYLPDVEGRFPALLSLSPYGKEQQYLGIPPQPYDSPLGDGTVEAGDTNYIVSRGYAHVIAELRGTGYSEGQYVGLFSKKEGEDGHDLVESIAKQPWCDGNVGMIGMSYFGATQLLTAAERPPHLKAICPYNAAADLYWMAYDGGILNSFLRRLWGLQVGGSGVKAGDVVSAMTRELPREELERRVREAMSNPDVRNYSYIYAVLAYPKVNPLLFDLMLNPTDGVFYWERSPHMKVDRIEVPVYCGTGLGATQLHILARTFDTYLRVKGPKKLLLTDISTPERPFHQWHDEFIRWFDYWLKGIDNGIMKEPPIKRFVSGANQWCYEKEWPPDRISWTNFYLRSRGRLSTEPEAIDTLLPNSFVQEPLTVTTELKSLKYLSPPLPKDTEAAGPVALYLFASTDAEDTNWMVTLYDVGTDGAQVTLSRGYLKASHRALDEAKSKPWLPCHLHTKPEPVVPGQIYQYAIEIQPISHLFKAGHCIGLQITSMDAPPGFHNTFHVGSSKVTVHKIYNDGIHRSHLLLPVIANTKFDATNINLS